MAISQLDAKAEMADEYDPLDVYDAAERFYEDRPMRIDLRHLNALAKEHANRPVTQVRNEAPWNNVHTRAEHNEQQRKFWAELCQKANQKQLFDPPEKYLQIVFLDDKPQWICACCLGDAKSEYLELKGEGGITNRMLLEKIGQAVYGTREDPRWFVGSEVERPVLKEFMAMTTGGPNKLVGNLYAIIRGIERKETDESGNNHQKITMEDLDGQDVL